jgi:uncharacterized protein (DUF2147 family)
MRRSTFAAVLALAVGTAVDAAAEASSPIGEWWTPGFNARVKIEPCGDALCGRIVWLWDESPRDIADRSALVGRKVIDAMQRDSTHRWRRGRLYNPEDGRHYEGSLDLPSPDRLVVSGCVLFLCKSQVWRRVDDTSCPPVSARGV